MEALRNLWWPCRYNAPYLNKRWQLFYLLGAECSPFLWRSETAFWHPQTLVTPRCASSRASETVTYDSKKPWDFAKFKTGKIFRKSLVTTYCVFSYFISVLFFNTLLNISCIILAMSVLLFTLRLFWFYSSSTLCCKCIPSFFIASSQVESLRIAVQAWKTELRKTEKYSATQKPTRNPHRKPQSILNSK